MSGVEIRVRANAKQAQNEIRKTGKSLKSLETQAANITKTFQKMAIGLTAAFGSAIIVKGITGATDAITSFNNKLATVTKNTTQQTAAFKELVAISKRTRTSMSGNVTAFQRFSLSLESLNKTTPQILKFTETFAKAGAVGGATAEEISNSAIQLGQGLAAGALRGEELNSVLENNVVAARLIAEEFGVGVGELKEMAAEGELTSQRIFDAFAKGAEGVDAAFSKMDATTDQLMTVMRDAMSLAISEFDKVIGVSLVVRSAISGITKAFDFVANNLERFVLKTQLSFLILESQTKDFLHGLLDLFSVDFDAAGLGERLGKSISNALKTVKDFGTQKVTIALNFAVEKYDLLSKMFPSGVEGIYGTLQTFADNIVAIFKGLWKAVVGNSWWTGIFDPAHEEGGAAAIGNVGAMGVHLEAARRKLLRWKDNLVALFKTLQTDALSYWTQLQTDLTNDGFSVVSSERIFQPLKAGFDNVLETLSTSWDNFATSTTGSKFNLSTTADMEQTWNTSLDTMKASYERVMATISGLPIVVAAKVAFQATTENFKEITDDVKSFFKDNEAELSTGIAIGMAAAFNKGLRGAIVRAAIPAGILAAVGGLGSNQDFLTAVGKTAKDFGTTFRNLMTGDGDVVANILEGLGNVFKEVGTSFIDGLFGEDFESKFVDNAASALSAGLVALILAPKLTKGAFNFALALGKLLGGKSLITGFKTKAAASIATGILELRTNPKTANAASKLGKVLGASVGATMSGLVAQQLSDALIPDESLNGIGEALDGAIGGAALGAQLGLAVGGPLGAAIGAAGGFLLGGLLDALNNPELIQKIKDMFSGAIDTFKTFVLTLPSTVGNAMKAGFSIAWDFLAGKLKTIRNFFSSGEDTGALSGAGYNQYAQQPNESDADYRERAQNFATGGYVSGAGTGTSDDIPAMLSNGEYVIKASAVSKLGKNKLDLLNQGVLPKFSNGGVVGTAQREIRDSFSRGDTKLSMEMISLVERLGKLDETMEGLTEVQQEAVKSLVEDDKDYKGKKATKLRLEGIDDLKETFNSTLSGAISAVLHGGDWKDVLKGLLDTVTSSIINNFTDGLVEGLTENFDFGKLFDFNQGTGEAGKKSGGFLSGFFGRGKSDKAASNKDPVEGISGVFDKAKGWMGNLFSEGGGLGKLFSGFGDSLGGIFSGLGSSLSGLMSGIGSLFGGGGAGGGGLGGLFSLFSGSFVAGFSQGGTVPSTSFSQAGKDSVPAMLMPGEVVLSKKDVSRMGSSNQGSTQQFNINVQGDVSRQTRQEIVKMMPQIAGGVNMQNKENNYKR